MSVVFDWSGTAPYTAPDGDAVLFDWGASAEAARVEVRLPAPVGAPAIQMGIAQHARCRLPAPMGVPIARMGRPWGDVDAYWRDTLLMLPMHDGLDRSHNTLTLSGTTSLTYDPDLPYGRLHEFNGVERHVFLPTSLYDDDFTIECWARINSPVYSEQHLVGFYGQINFTNTIGIRVTPDGNLYVYGFPMLDLPVGVTFDAWHHFAVTRQGGTQRIWYDGALVHERMWTNAIEQGQVLLGNTSFKGFLADVRITKHRARYVSPFTPPPPESLCIELSNVAGDPVTGPLGAPVARDLFIVPRYGVGGEWFGRSGFRTTSSSNGRWRYWVYRMPHAVIFFDDLGQRPDLMVAPVLQEPV